MAFAAVWPKPKAPSPPPLPLRTPSSRPPPPPHRTAPRHRPAPHRALHPAPPRTALRRTGTGPAPHRSHRHRHRRTRPAPHRRRTGHPAFRRTGTGPRPGPVAPHRSHRHRTGTGQHRAPPSAAPPRHRRRNPCLVDTAPQLPHRSNLLHCNRLGVRARCSDMPCRRRRRRRRLARAPPRRRPRPVPPESQRPSPRPVFLAPVSLSSPCGSRAGVIGGLFSTAPSPVTRAAPAGPVRALICRAAPLALGVLRTPHRKHTKPLIMHHNYGRVDIQSRIVQQTVSRPSPGRRKPWD
jgi:hypothetical protein